MANRGLLLGAVLLLLAIGYQYREQLLSLLAQESSGQPKQRPSRPEDQPSAAVNTDRSEEEGFFNPPFSPDDPPRYSKSGVRLVTVNELAEHGHAGSVRPLWLAVLGMVFDVEKGAEHYYGPNGGYNFFTGRDGSRAYVTGEFNEEGLIPSIDGLTPAQVGELDGWVKFYEKDYTFVGKLIGHYYTQDGSPTRHWYRYQRALADKEKLDTENERLKKRFPPCNSHWTQNDGGRVYCSDSSGGVQRDWEGLPRRYFAPGARSWRCACVHGNDLSSPQVKLYPSCAEDAKECKVYPEQIAKLKQEEARGHTQ